MTDKIQEAKEAEWDRYNARQQAKYEPDLCRCGECIANRKERRKAARAAKKAKT